MAMLFNPQWIKASRQIRMRSPMQAAMDLFFHLEISIGFHLLP